MTRKAIERLGARFSLGASELGSIRVRRTVTANLPAGGVAEARDRFWEELDREYAALRRISSAVLRIVEWKHGMRSEWDEMRRLDVTVGLEVDADDAELVARFVAEYSCAESGPIDSVRAAARLAPLVHSVRFPCGDLPRDDEIASRLEREWSTLRRVLTLGQAAGDGVVTRRVPPPFLDSRPSLSKQEVPLVARAATPEEAKSYTERYLDRFRFPIEVEEDGVRYAFIPRVEVSRQGDAIKLIVTLLGPPEGDRATFRLGGNKSVTVPLDEIYVQGDELNRKTKEGLLELIKGLCRALGKERGISGIVDISRPH